MKLFTYIALIMLLVACGSNPTDSSQGNIYNINPEKESPIEDFISEYVGHVALETTDKSLIGTPSIIKISGNDIYIYSYDEGVMRFDVRTGKFLNQIGRKGRGPGEYVHLADFDIYDGKLYAYSMLDRKLNVYSIDGSFIEQIKTPQNTLFKMNLDNRGNIWFSSEGIRETGQEGAVATTHEYMLLDTESGTYSAMFDEIEENEKGFLRIGATPFIGKQDGAILTAMAHDPTIYRLTPESYEPYITININLDGNITVEESRREELFSIMNSRSGNVDYFDCFKSLTESDKAIICMAACSFKETRALTLVKIDKKSNETKFIRLSNSGYKEFPYLNEVFDEVGGIQGGMILSVVPAEKLCDKEEFKHLKEDDNPVIFFHRLNLK